MIEFSNEEILEVTALFGNYPGLHIKSWRNFQIEVSVDTDYAARSVCMHILKHQTAKGDWYGSKNLVLIRFIISRPPWQDAIRYMMSMFPYWHEKWAFHEARDGEKCIEVDV